MNLVSPITPLTGGAESGLILALTLTGFLDCYRREWGLFNGFIDSGQAKAEGMK